MNKISKCYKTVYLFPNVLKAERNNVKFSKVTRKIIKRLVSLTELELRVYMANVSRTN